MGSPRVFKVSFRPPPSPDSSNRTSLPSSERLRSLDQSNQARSRPLGWPGGNTTTLDR